MPVLDGSFEAFVTNLGKYNEGALVGEWVKFPTTEEEMQKVFERIGIGSKDEFGQVYEEWFITDYECPVHGVYDMLGEYESLDKLNYLASRIEELDTWEQEKFDAIMEAGCDEVSDIDDLINLTYNLDCYNFIPNILDASDLGYHYIYESGIYSEKELGPFPTTLTTNALVGMWQWTKTVGFQMRAISTTPETDGIGILMVLWMTSRMNTASPELAVSRRGIIPSPFLLSSLGKRLV